VFEDGPHARRDERFVRSSSRSMPDPCTLGGTSGRVAGLVPAYILVSLCGMYYVVYLYLQHTHGALVQHIW
jgi:hypothetical protein